jgi:hypothetical protein
MVTPPSIPRVQTRIDFLSARHFRGVCIDLCRRRYEEINPSMAKQKGRRAGMLDFVDATDDR